MSSQKRNENGINEEEGKWKAKVEGGVKLCCPNFASAHAITFGRISRQTRYRFKYSEASIKRTPSGPSQVSS